MYEPKMIATKIASLVLIVVGFSMVAEAVVDWSYYSKATRQCSEIILPATAFLPDECLPCCYNYAQFGRIEFQPPSPAPICHCMDFCTNKKQFHPCKECCENLSLIHTYTEDEGCKCSTPSGAGKRDMPESVLSYDPLAQ